MEVFFFWWVCFLKSASLCNYILQSHHVVALLVLFLLSFAKERAGLKRRRRSDPQVWCRRKHLETARPATFNRVEPPFTGWDFLLAFQRGTAVHHSTNAVFVPP